MRRIFDVVNPDNRDEKVTAEAYTRQAAIWRFFGEYPERETEMRKGEPLSLILTDYKRGTPLTSHVTFRPVMFAEIVTPGEEDPEESFHI